MPGRNINPGGSAKYDVAAYCAGIREREVCPISGTTCPGDCIFSYVLENINVGIIVFDVSRETVIFQNAAATEILGKSVRPKDYHAILTLFSLAGFAAGEKVNMPRSLTFGEKLIGFTLYHVKGEYLWLFVHDITEKKKEEEQLVRLVAAVESTEESISIINTEGIIQYVNAAFEKITGYAREEAVGRRSRIFTGGRHGRAFCESIMQTLKQGNGWRGHVLSSRKDGTTYEADIVISPIRDASGEIASFVQVERDVTEKMRLESVAEAINSMNNIGYVFSGLRHEIGNPINSIKISLSVLAHNLEGYSKETVRTYIDRTMAEIGRVEYLLRTMKSFNMYECPKLEDVAMASFMEKFLSLVRGDFEARGIDLVAIVHPEVQQARVDPRALHQVLLNILTNAGDACSGRQTPKIVVSLFASGSRVCVSIMDNGPGISPEQREKLFIPFYTTKVNGTGLGLTIVKKMLAKMEGTVSVTSQEEAGTIVDIWLPEGGNGRP